MDTKTTTRSGKQLGLALALIASTLIAGSVLRTAASGATKPPGTDPTPWTASAGEGVRFSAQLDRAAVLRERADQVRLELVIGAPQQAVAVRVPTDLVIVLDRSGSMEGRKIADARQAVLTLIDHLGPDDRMALVTYAQRAERVFPLERPIPHHRQEWRQILSEIAPGGGTNLSAGLDIGLAITREARASGRARRIVLLSDGLANQGDLSPEGLRARAARAVSGGFVLSTIGVGVDFNGELLATLADQGTGNFHYLETTANLARVLAAEFDTARESVAQALAVELHPEPGVRLLDAAGYPLDQSGDGVVRIHPGGLFAGQERRIWLTLEVPPGDGEFQELGDLSLAYRVGDEHIRVHLPEAPRLARVAGKAAYLEAIDVGQFERGVGVSSVSRMQRLSANAVAAGRPEEALPELRRVREGLAELNAAVGSEAVEKDLDEMEALEKKLEDHAAGKVRLDKASVQQLRALGYRVGRPGSRK